MSYRTYRCEDILLRIAACLCRFPEAFGIASITRGEEFSDSEV